MALLQVVVYVQVFFQTLTEFIISTCAVFVKKKRNFILDPPRCTEPAHHGTSDQNVSSWLRSSIHLLEFIIRVVLYPGTWIHTGGTRPFIMLSNFFNVEAILPTF